MSSGSSKGNVTGSPGDVVVLCFIRISRCKAAEKARWKKISTGDKMVGEGDERGEERIARAGFF